MEDDFLWTLTVKIALGIKIPQIYPYRLPVSPSPCSLTYAWHIFSRAICIHQRRCLSLLKRAYVGWNSSLSSTEWLSILRIRLWSLVIRYASDWSRSLSLLGFNLTKGGEGRGGRATNSWLDLGSWTLLPKQLPFHWGEKDKSKYRKLQPSLEHRKTVHICLSLT